MYSHADHPLNGVYKGMIADPEFKKLPYDDIVWLIDRETRLLRKDDFYAHVFATAVILAVLYFVPQLRG